MSEGIKVVPGYVQGGWIVLATFPAQVEDELVALVQRDDASFHFAVIFTPTTMLDTPIIPTVQYTGFLMAVARFAELLYEECATVEQWHARSKTVATPDNPEWQNADGTVNQDAINHDLSTLDTPAEEQEKIAQIEEDAREWQDHLSEYKGES